MNVLQLTRFVAACWCVPAALHAAPVRFDLPAQPGHIALMAFARQTKTEVLFSSEEMKKVRTASVVGTYEPKAALELMLEGTGFTAQVTAAGKILVQRAAAPPAPAQPKPAAPPATGPGRSSRASPDDEVVRLADLVVTPSRYGIADEHIARNVTLTSEELARLPQIGEDVYRTINRLPGLGGNEISAKFLVRGAPNRQVLSRYDGVDLIEPFHLKDWDSALSIIDLETVGSLDLVTGGFTAEYGDRMAGVLNIESQPEVGGRLLTTLGLSVTGMRATNQGTFADGEGQWLVAARRGYIDLALELGGSEVEDSPVYYDFSGKVQYRLNPNHSVSLHLLHAGDTLESLNTIDPDLRSSYDSTYVWGRWTARFGEGISGETVLSFSDLGWHRRGDGQHDELHLDEVHPFHLRDDRTLSTVGLRSDWNLNLTPRVLARTGFELTSGEARYDYTMSRERWLLQNGSLGTSTLAVNTHLRPEGRRIGAHAALRFWPWEPLVIEPGVRFDRQTHSGDSDWSPRLNASFTLGRTTVQAAWGIYRQAQGLHELSVGDGERSFRRAEQAEHRILGVSHRLPAGIDLRIEAYERLSTRLRPYWINPIEPFELFPETLYDRLQLAPSRGRARGIELMAENRRGRRFGWSASYTYAISEELIGNRWTPRYWDQRHTFYVDATYSPAPNWQLSAAWQWHTGWPFTDINYYPVPLNNGGLAYSWTYGPIGGLRAPAYHRLDLRATRTYRLRRGTLRVYVDLWNAYNQENKVGFDDHYAYFNQGRLVVVKTPGTMLPLLPSAGVSWEF